MSVVDFGSEFFFFFFYQGIGIAGKWGVGKYLDIIKGRFEMVGWLERKYIFSIRGDGLKKRLLLDNNSNLMEILKTTCFARCHVKC